jgi:tetraacyldisaccharide 4'-kinase
VPASEPSWWYGPGGGWQTALLSPIGAIVGAIASRRLQNAKPYRSALTVICVGNFTAGGSGKTPLALLLAKLVADDGREPWFLSRGYGGRLKGPVRVDTALHSASDVGDEPLLLARAAPTVIARNRREGAETIEALASKKAVIIMDDGLQNPVLAKDLSIAVVDARRGFGNGRVIPAGPLRAPLNLQMKLASLIVLTGQNSGIDAPVVQTLRGLTEAPIVSAQTRADDSAAKFRGQRLVAFAGIANPDRFFSTLCLLGAEIIERRPFADHHVFSEAEARDLIEAGKRVRAVLVTTEKDLARLSGATGACGMLRVRSEALAIRTVIEGNDLEVVHDLIRRALAR